MNLGEFITFFWKRHVLEDKEILDVLRLVSLKKLKLCFIGCEKHLWIDGCFFRQHTFYC